MTSADALRLGIIIRDLVPGGLEPLDPNLAEGADHDPFHRPVLGVPFQVEVLAVGVLHWVRGGVTRHTAGWLVDWLEW